MSRPSATKLVTLINTARLRKASKVGTQQHIRHISQCAAVEAAEYEEPETEQQTKTTSTYLDKLGKHSNTNEKSNRMMMTEGIRMKQNWIPHPRSGIYYPEGHDWVMDDVSENAASLGQSHPSWLRNNIHGAEKNYPDLHSADDYFLTTSSDRIFD